MLQKEEVVSRLKDVPHIKANLMRLNRNDELCLLTIEAPKLIARNYAELMELLNDSACSRVKIISDEEVKIVKFLLRTDDKLVFAHCGIVSPENNIPSYIHLTGEELYNAQCITAGEAMFTEKNELFCITNICRDFLVPFSSLSYAFPHFADLALPKAENFMLGEYAINAGSFRGWHSIAPTTLNARANLPENEDINSIPPLVENKISAEKKITSADSLFFAHKQNQKELGQQPEAGTSLGNGS